VSSAPGWCSPCGRRWAAVLPRRDPAEGPAVHHDPPRRLRRRCRHRCWRGGPPHAPSMCRTSSKRGRRVAIGQVGSWTRGDVTMTGSRTAGGHAIASTRPLFGAARHAAFAAGQPAVVAPGRGRRARRAIGRRCHAPFLHAGTSRDREARRSRNGVKPASRTEQRLATACVGPSPRPSRRSVRENAEQRLRSGDRASHCRSSKRRSSTLEGDRESTLLVLPLRRQPRDHRRRQPGRRTAARPVRAGLCVRVIVDQARCRFERVDLSAVATFERHRQALELGSLTSASGEAVRPSC
jgi:hypothetical protein